MDPLAASRKSKNTNKNSFGLTAVNYSDFLSRIYCRRIEFSNWNGIKWSQRIYWINKWAQNSS
jgi:hypothetical protein